MTPFSRPACTADVNYTVTQKATVPHDQWATFVLAITEVFWLLPVNLRPCNPVNGLRMERSSELFQDPEMFLFSGMNGGDFTDQSMLITRFRSDSTDGKLDVIAPHGQPQNKTPGRREAQEQRAKSPGRFTGGRLTLRTRGLKIKGLIRRL